MPERFIRFSALLRSTVSAAPDLPTQNVAAVDVCAAPQPRVPDGERELAREVAHFRARLAESFEAAQANLMRKFAREMLARELQLAPADVAEIVRSTCEGVQRSDILRVRVNPQDIPALLGDIPMLADEYLTRGDAIVELHQGSLDASVSIRFESLLAAVSADASP